MESPFKSAETFEFYRNIVSEINHPSKLGTFQFYITDETGIVHEWIIDFRNKMVTRGTTSLPDVIISATDNDFQECRIQFISSKDAIASGKLKVAGNKVMYKALVEYGLITFR